MCLSLQQNEVTDSAYLGSESTYSECETFTDEDTGALVPPEMHEDVETDSGIEATLHDPEDGGNRSVQYMLDLFLFPPCIHMSSQNFRHMLPLLLDQLFILLYMTGILSDFCQAYGDCGCLCHNVVRSPLATKVYLLLFLLMLQLPCSECSHQSQDHQWTA